MAEKNVPSAAGMACTGARFLYLVAQALLQSTPLFSRHLRRQHAQGGRGSWRSAKLKSARRRGSGVRLLREKQGVHQGYRRLRNPPTSSSTELGASSCCRARRADATEHCLELARQYPMSSGHGAQRLNGGQIGERSGICMCGWHYAMSSGHGAQRLHGMAAGRLTRSRRALQGS